MGSGHFWLKDGNRSVGGSGPLGWAALALTLVLMYLFVPPFTQLVDGIVEFVKTVVIIALVIAGASGIAYAVAKAKE